MIRLRSIRRWPLMFWIAFLPVWCGTLSAQMPSQTATVGGPFRIAGTIVNAMNGAPLGRARVSLTQVRSQARGFSVVTSDSGRFEFTSLPAGKFSLLGAKGGFLTSTYDQHGPLSTAIVTGAGLETENLTLRLTPLAMLSGRLFDETGEAVRNTQVTIHTPGNREGLRQVEFAGRAVTDDQGSYEFAALEPGTYFLCVSAMPWYAVHPPSTPRSGAENAPTSVDASLDVAYPVTFYNGATESDAATPISLKGGEHRQVDVHLSPVPALHVMIRYPTGDKPRMFGAPALERNIFNFTDHVMGDGSGFRDENVVEVMGIPPGKYTMQTMGGLEGEAERTVEINLLTGAEEVDFSKAVPTANVKVALQMPTGEPSPRHLYAALQESRTQRFVAGQEVDASGEVTLMNVPAGKYVVIAGATQGQYGILHMNSGGQEVSGRQITVAAGMNMDLTVFFSRGAVSVEGFVKRDGKPVAGAMVVLVPKDTEGEPDSFRRDQSDLDGSFIVRDVVPGTYSLIAIENGWDVEWRKPNALNRYLEHGQQLTVGPLMRGSVSLPEAVQAVR